MRVWKRVLNFLIGIIILTSNNFAETEKKIGIDLAPSALVEIDVLQSFADNDKTGSAALGRFEAGIEAAAGEKVDAGVYIELGNEYAINLLETWFTFKPVEVLSLTAGHVTMPFGEYRTELFTDPLVLCGFVDDSIVIPGAEIIATGFKTGIDINGFFTMAGVYNSPYTNRFEAFGVKLGYYFKEIIFLSASGRFEPYSKIDLDVSLYSRPIPFFAVIGEVYTGLKNGDNENRLIGIHTELEIIPIEKLTIPVRFGQMVDNSNKGTGYMQLASGARYLFNKHITFGIEFNSTAKIVNGETGSFDNLGIRFAFSVE